MNGVPILKDVASGLADVFDAVIVLTDSAWRTDPLDSRFLYAREFARTLPVIVIAPAGQAGATALQPQPGGCEGVTVVHLPIAPSMEQTEGFNEILLAREIRRPLFWLVNCDAYLPVLDAWPNAMRVYRASFDGEAVGVSHTRSLHDVAVSFGVTLAHHVDLVLASSPGVAEAYRKYGDYSGALQLVAPGCDITFLSHIATGTGDDRAGAAPKAVVIPGPIDGTLDYELLHEVVHALPDWQFRCYGAAQTGLQQWEALAAHENVRHYATLDAATLLSLGKDVAAAWDPRKLQEGDTGTGEIVRRNFEALGLPLIGDEGQQDAARCQIVVSALVQAQQHGLRAGVVAADVQGIDIGDKFLQAERLLLECYAQQLAKPLDQRLNIAVLYDDRWTHVGTVEEHVTSFQKYSRHNIYFVPISRQTSLRDYKLAEEVDFSMFDVLIYHYAVRLSLKDYLPEPMARKIERFTGLKILFIQDEYDTTNTARAWIRRLAFDMVYTCVPPEGREYVYPASCFQHTEFLATLTGYVPEDPSLGRYQVPLRERQVMVAYRGRMLPYFYGSLGWQKYRIGVDVKELAQARGLNVDIEVDDSKRIYGMDWYRFMGSARATLGTESGSNVFDFDGTLRSKIEKILDANPGASFDDLYRELLEPLERNIRMNQVSPKIFEAIRLRTALVLFEGEYSGVVQPWIHYIPLRQDYSNIDEVFAKLQDFDFLERLTERAYEDVVASGKYSYRTFVQGVDADIERRWLRGARARIYATPILTEDNHGNQRLVMPRGVNGWCLSTSTLGGSMQREQLETLVGERLRGMAALLLRERVRTRMADGLRGIYRRSVDTARAVWRRLPVPRPARRLASRVLRGMKARLLGRG
ncbi:hypothetical protein WHX56_03825 [Achromobacter veterisilvae]|uniref:Glycosyltransferase 2-like domain-containing protein n=1 Tax=Achromobacter veterisilvae TaxID=2069367 RepID=A0ABZ2S180_9BURK